MGCCEGGCVGVGVMKVKAFGVGEAMGGEEDVDVVTDEVLDDDDDDEDDDDMDVKEGGAPATSLLKVAFEFEFEFELKLELELEFGLGFLEFEFEFELVRFCMKSEMDLERSAFLEERRRSMEEPWVGVLGVLSWVLGSLGLLSWVVLFFFFRREVRGRTGELAVIDVSFILLREASLRWRR